MRNLASLGLCLFLFTSCTIWAPQQQVSRWSQATGGEQLVRLFWQEVKEKDWKELDRHMASTLVSANAQQVMDRSALLAHLKEFELADYALGEVNVQPNGNDLVVSYTVMLRGTVAGRPMPETLRVLSVWQRLGHGWVLIAQSAMAPALPSQR
jgi:hypothetical protein